jgi:hypothetical protein
MPKFVFSNWRELLHQAMPKGAVKASDTQVIERYLEYFLHS